MLIVGRDERWGISAADSLFVPDSSYTPRRSY
jgi:hypothetical protein